MSLLNSMHVKNSIKVAWCSHCKQFAQDYIQFANKMKIVMPKVQVGLFDCTKNENLAKKFDVTGYPTFKFFYHGHPIHVTSQRHMDIMVFWVRDRLKENVTEILTEKDAKKFQEVHSQKKTLIYFGKDDKPAGKEFYKVAKTQEHRIRFAHVDGKRIRKLFNVRLGKTKMVFYVKGKRMDYGGPMGFQDIMDFIKGNEHGNPPELNGESSQFLLDDKRWVGHLTYISVNEFYEDKKEILISFQDKLKGMNITVSHCRAESDPAKEILEIYGLEKIEKSTAFFLGIQKGEDYQKYLQEEELTAENLIPFVQDAQEGKIEKIYRSQKPPIENEDLIVKSIVRDNFKEKLLDVNDNVLLVIFSKESKKSKSFMPIFDRAAKHLKAKNENFVFFKYDYLENDITEVEVESLPSVYLFKSGEKDQPILIASKTQNSEILNDEEEIYEAINKHTPINFDIDPEAKLKEKVNAEINAKAEEEKKAEEENVTQEAAKEEEKVEKFETEAPEKVEL